MYAYQRLGHGANTQLDTDAKVKSHSELSVSNLLYVIYYVVPWCSIWASLKNGFALPKAWVLPILSFSL